MTTPLRLVDSNSFNNFISQENEIKIHEEAISQSEEKFYSQKLDVEETRRFNEITKKSIRIVFRIPSDTKPEVLLAPFTLKGSVEGLMKQLEQFELSLSISQILDFLNDRLLKKGIIEKPECDVGGGATRYTLAKMSYADVDVSFHLCKARYQSSQYRAIIETLIELILEEFLKKDIQLLYEDPNIKTLIRQCCLPLIKEIKNEESQLVALFIGLEGLDLKFISDETYRWNAAAHDSFCISYPERMVRSVDNGKVCSKSEFIKNANILFSRQFEVKEPNRVSGLIFRVVLAMTQGFEISQPYIHQALDQFKARYPKRSFKALTDKLHHHLDVHYLDNEKGKMFDFLNFLFLTLHFERPEDQNDYAEIIATSWQQRTFKKNGRTFLYLANAIQTEPGITKDLLTLIWGIGLYEYIQKNRGIQAYTFEFASSSKRPLWQLSLTSGKSIQFLTLPCQDPVEMLKSFSSAWQKLANSDRSSQCASILKELGFTSVSFSNKDRDIVLRNIAEAFDNPPLATVLSTYFQKAKPLSFYSYLQKEVPDAIDPSYLAHKQLLGDLWELIMESNGLDKNEENLIGFLRIKIKKMDAPISLVDLKQALKLLQAVPNIVLKPALKNAVERALVQMISRAATSNQISILKEAMQLVLTKDFMEILSEQNKAIVTSCLVMACEKIAKHQDSRQLIEFYRLCSSLTLWKKHTEENQKALYNLSRLLSESLLRTSLHNSLDEKRENVSIAALNIVWESQHVTELLPQIQSVYDKLVLRYARSSNSQQWRSIAELSMRLPEGIKYAQSQLLLEVADKLMVIDEGNIEKGHTKKEYQELGVKLLAKIAQQESLENKCREEIRLRSLKGMASSLKLKGQQFTHNYQAFLEVFDSLSSVQKSHGQQLIDLKGLLNLNMDSSRSQIVRLFLQIVMKIDLTFTEQLVPKLNDQISVETDRQAVHSSLALLKIMDEFDCLIKVLKCEKQAVAEVEGWINKIIPRLEILWTADDALLISKTLRSTLLEMIGSKAPGILRNVDKLLNASKKVNFINASQISEINYLIFNTYALRGELPTLPVELFKSAWESLDASKFSFDVLDNIYEQMCKSTYPEMIHVAFSTFMASPGANPRLCCYLLEGFLKSSDSQYLPNVEAILATNALTSVSQVFTISDSMRGYQALFQYLINICDKPDKVVQKKGVKEKKINPVKLREMKDKCLEILEQQWNEVSKHLTDLAVKDQITRIGCARIEMLIKEGSGKSLLTACHLFNKTLKLNSSEIALQILDRFARLPASQYFRGISLEVIEVMHRILCIEKTQLSDADILSILRLIKGLPEKNNKVAFFIFDNLLEFGIKNQPISEMNKEQLETIISLLHALPAKFLKPNMYEKIFKIVSIAKRFISPNEMEAYQQKLIKNFPPAYFLQRFIVFLETLNTDSITESIVYVARPLLMQYEHYDPKLGEKMVELFLSKMKPVESKWKREIKAFREAALKLKLYTPPKIKTSETDKKSEEIVVDEKQFLDMSKDEFDQFANKDLSDFSNEDIDKIMMADANLSLTSMVNPGPTRMDQKLRELVTIYRSIEKENLSAQCEVNMYTNLFRKVLQFQEDLCFNIISTGKETEYLKFIYLFIREVLTPEGKQFKELSRWVRFFSMAIDQLANYPVIFRQASFALKNFKAQGKNNSQLKSVVPMILLDHEATIDYLMNQVQTGQSKNRIVTTAAGSFLKLIGKEYLENAFSSQVLENMERCALALVKEITYSPMCASCVEIDVVSFSQLILTLLQKKIRDVLVSGRLEGNLQTIKNLFRFFLTGEKLSDKAFKGYIIFLNQSLLRLLMYPYLFQNLHDLYLKDIHQNIAWSNQDYSSDDFETYIKRLFSKNKVLKKLIASDVFIPCEDAFDLLQTFDKKEWVRLHDEKMFFLMQHLLFEVIEMIMLNASAFDNDQIKEISKITTKIGAYASIALPEKVLKEYLSRAMTSLKTSMSS